MRIGILTLPLYTNYGGIIQAYALQTVLERMGHEVTVIGRKRKRMTLPVWKKPLVYTKRLLLKTFKNPDVKIFYEQYQWLSQPVIARHTDAFIRKHIHYIELGSYEELKNSDKFDAYVVGSDQVWRPVYFGEPIEYAFLCFTAGQNVRRVAYAASFGTDEWEYSAEQTERCKKLLKQFDAVSVREKSAVDLCQRYLNCNAHWVLDPTMFLCMEDYVRLFEAANTTKSKGTLLYYILDDTQEKMEFIESVAKNKRLVPFRVGCKVIRYASLEELTQPPLEEWLRGFHDAEFIVTDSFHACVFSIIFQKPFVVIGNKERGMARFESLLSMFGLEDRLVSFANNTVEQLADIDYQKVFSLLNEYNICSIGFLKENCK